MQQSLPFKGSCLALLAALLLGACGGGSTSAPLQIQSPGSPAGLRATFHRGPVLSAVEAEVALDAPAGVTSASFTVHAKPSSLSEDIHVTYTRSYLERTASIDTMRGTIRFPVFGLYREYDNRITIRVTDAAGAVAEQVFAISTVGLAYSHPPPLVNVELSDADLDVSFLLIQAFDNLLVVDIDGEVRWQGPLAADSLFPRLFTPQGLVVGSTSSPAVYRYDWMGRSEISTFNDGRCRNSHHNFAQGPAGILNTITLAEGDVQRGLSILAEMTPQAEILRLWDFDQIVSDAIRVQGEDPSALIRTDYNWFHMNSAIYDASDDSVIVSSRENFVIKADYATGAVKWILGNKAKSWFTDFPLSLQPLALEVVGDAPIGQHSLSVSPDGRHLMLFNNGQGHFNLPDIGDTRAYSKVSMYEIDEAARTAIEIWSYDHDQEIFSPVCSSADPTKDGNVIVTYASPDGDGNPIIEIVDTFHRVLFRAQIEGPGCFVAYAAEDVPFGALVID